MKESGLGALYLGGAASIWGGMFVASKYALEVIPPFTLLFIRFFLAFFILFWWQNREEKIGTGKGQWKQLLQVGAIGYFLSIAAQFVGTKLSSAHMGAVITTLSPVFQSAFAVLLLREEMEKRQIAAMTASFAGVLVVTGIPEAGAGSMWSGGSFFFLLAAASWGYVSVVIKKLTGKCSPLAVTTWGVGIAGILAVGPAAGEWGTWDALNLLEPAVMCSVLFIAWIATAGAFFCWSKGLTMMSSHQAGLFFFLQPVVGSLLGWLLLGEKLEMSFLLGTFLILSGVYMTSEKRSRNNTEFIPETDWKK